MSREYELPAAAGDRDRRIRDRRVVCGGTHDGPTSWPRCFASVFLVSQGSPKPPMSDQLSQLPVARETRKKTTDKDTAWRLRDPCPDWVVGTRL
jgi:hypothetical protein